MSGGGWEQPHRVPGQSAQGQELVGDCRDDGWQVSWLGAGESVGVNVCVCRKVKVCIMRTRSE